MHLLKQHEDIVLPYITSMVNGSLQSSTMPANMKSALVHPLLKKLGLPLIKDLHQICLIFPRSLSGQCAIN